MKLFAIFTGFYLLNVPTAFALQSCNSNVDCRGSWICVGGTAANGESNYTGICRPNIIMRQVCLVYNLATGVFGKGLTLLAIAVFGGKFLLQGSGGVKVEALLAFAIGLAFVFGAPVIINLITSQHGAMCDFGGA